MKTVLEDKDFDLLPYGVTLEQSQKDLLIKLENETYEMAEQKQDYFCFLQGMELCWFLMCDALILLQKLPTLVLDIGLASEISQLKEKIAVIGGKLSLYELILDLDSHRVKRYIPYEDNHTRYPNKFWTTQNLTKEEKYLSI